LNACLNDIDNKIARLKANAQTKPLVPALEAKASAVKSAKLKPE